MRAIRKRESAPGLALEEVPVPTPGPDEVLVRIEAASHLRHRPPHQPLGPVVVGARPAAADARPRAVRHGRRDREARCATSTEGDYVSAESHVTCGVCFHCRTGQGAHVRADADPRRRPRRRLRRLRRDSRLGRLAERPLEAPARDRLPAGAVRQRRLRDVDAGPRRSRRRRARLRAGRPLHDRDREGVRRGAALRLRPRPVPAGARARRSVPTPS